MVFNSGTTTNAVRGILDPSECTHKRICFYPEEHAVCQDCGATGQVQPLHCSYPDGRRRPVIRTRRAE